MHPFAANTLRFEAQLEATKAEAGVKWADEVSACFHEIWQGRPDIPPATPCCITLYRDMKCRKYKGIEEVLLLRVVWNCSVVQQVQQMQQDLSDERQQRQNKLQEEAKEREETCLVILTLGYTFVKCVPGSYSDFSSPTCGFHLSDRRPMTRQSSAISICTIVVQRKFCSMFLLALGKPWIRHVIFRIFSRVWRWMLG